MGKIESPWQETKEVLSLFGQSKNRAREKYRQFVMEGVAHGKRQDLMGGGLVRSAGGWESVAALRRGRETYRSDERILGSSEFVETILREAEKKENKKNRTQRVGLETLKQRISKEYQIPLRLMESSSRVSEVSQARAVLCYVWISYLGRSGRQLAEALSISPQAVYLASERIDQDNDLNEHVLERWCK